MDAVTLASECRDNAVQVLQPKTADDPGYSPASLSLTTRDNSGPAIRCRPC